MMNKHIIELQDAIIPLRKKIINHTVYGVIKDIEDLRIFMEYHVYAVWDFMSLLKSLQAGLTCTRIPWFPVGSADTRYLINEIVLGEESDIDDKGIRKSHFEIYIDAMLQAGANVTHIQDFTRHLSTSGNFVDAFRLAEVPGAAKEFVNFTFKTINSRNLAVQSAIFTFGREDLIPGMFIALVSDIHNNFPEAVSTFKYYLERHIEVDGDHHSKLAIEMTSNLCGDNEELWAEAERLTKISLEKRIQLWDAVSDRLLVNNTKRPLIDS